MLAEEVSCCCGEEGVHSGNSIWYNITVFFFAIGMTIVTIGVATITLFPSHNCDLQIIHVAEDQGPCCSVMSKL